MEHDKYKKCLNDAIELTRSKKNSILIDEAVSDAKKELETKAINKSNHEKINKLNIGPEEVEKTLKELQEMIDTKQKMLNDSQ